MSATGTTGTRRCDLCGAVLSIVGASFHECVPELFDRTADTLPPPEPALDHWSALSRAFASLGESDRGLLLALAERMAGFGNGRTP